MAAGGSSLFEAEIGKYLLESTALKNSGQKLYLGFCQKKCKKTSPTWATEVEELQGEAGKGYAARLEVKAAQLNMVVTEQAGELGEAKKGAQLKNSAEAKVFTAVPGAVTHPKAKFAFIARHTSSKFEEGELLQMIELSPEVEILSTTTEFSFATGELVFEVL